MTSVIHSMASLSRAGREHGVRKTNQDTCFAFRQFVHPHQAIAAVLDGHGPHGHHVSAFLRQQLPVVVAAQLKRRGEVAAPAALAASFLEAQTALRGAAAAINARLSGSTAVVTLLQGRRLTVAWVGDSRAMLVRREPGGAATGIALTRDHKPTSAAELARILAAGGRVERLSDASGREVGPHRVWLPGAWVPGLAMSRALGDFVAGSVGVSAVPDTAVAELHPGDEFLVVASDGVWEFMTVAEAAEVVAGCGTAEEACRAVSLVGLPGWGVREAAGRMWSLASRTDARCPGAGSTLPSRQCRAARAAQLVDAATEVWAVRDEGITDDITVVAAKFLAPGGGGQQHC
jgi:serine/threonine protein phosphatase PrpC